MIQRRIRRGEVAIGQPLPWNVYNDKGVLLLAEGNHIQSGDQLDRLLELGIYIESTLTWHLQPESALQHVLHACYRLAVLLKQPVPPADFSEQVLNIARLIDTAWQLDAGVVMATVVLRRGGRYAVRHAVNTACVVAGVLQAMGPAAPERESTLAAALTMNLGMLDLQDVLARQTEPLTPSQQVRVSCHPLASLERLRKAGVNDETWLRAVLEHHEAIDGSGYPHRLRGPGICPSAQLLGLADLFCARVSERGYRRADSAKIVLRDVLIERGRHFDVMLAAYFIKALGVYPIGTVVLLANGEIGVVSGRTDRVDTPWVHALLAADGSPHIPPLRRSTQPTSLTIVETLSATDVGVPIDMEAIWGEQAHDFQLGQQEARRQAVDFSI
ncbi:phosphohydrolase [Chitinimonas arctica]|uniref:Phosphohydrolase n=1 Tax=Chitinimonas arctica TaxID=2594795 RepID=A0A516SKS6_9NEIS|nr:HD domain-containing phosphohydrolase [Chitinimonas arctica]QDQ28762.1 phosphohydrolase [Chitinimonas arctica]